MTTPPRDGDAPLTDGSYDVMILDAGEAETSSGVWVDVAVVAGDHKGEVLSLAATNIEADPIGLLGMPATMIVSAGVPTLQVEP